MEPDSEKNGKDRFIYSEAPLLVYWELTRACDLACRHCRAEAIADRSAEELTFSEAEDLLEKVQQFGNRSPHLVLTGGDPLKRPDLFDLLAYGHRLGLKMSVAPSSTYALTREVFQMFRLRGVESIALSLDGSSPQRHDSFRGVDGCFDWTLGAARLAREEGISLQINTLVTAETEADLPEISKLVRDLGALRWSLFFLIQVGRGRGLSEASPERCEELHHWIYDVSKTVPFAVKTTEAPHFRRVALRRMRAEGMSFARILKSSVGRGFGIRDGNGIMFISHTGEVYPSGFLPLSAGNVRNVHIAEVYRDSEIFKRIRKTTEFKGRCGLCEFREICGGSRARAYATFGDYLAEDPSCSYKPASYCG